MHWILQENLFKEAEWDTLVNTLESFELPYSVHKVIPFVGELVPPPQPQDYKVICFGSYSMRHSAKQFGWKPGVYDLFDQNFLLQREKWGERMLNHDSTVIAFKDAHLDEPRFIRPIDDSKYFAGAVFDAEDFNGWRTRVCVLEEDYGSGLSPDTLIQICNPKEIYSEYRFWVVDGQVVTASRYKLGTRVTYAPSSTVDPRFFDFAAECVALWQPKPAFVLDLCDTDEGIKIVEINTINSAGFYAGDVQKMINALERMEA
jgi:hypothetical protein